MSRRVARRFREQRRKDQRVVQAIAVVFVGTLVAVGAGGRIQTSELGGSLLTYGLMVAVGACGVLRLQARWRDLTGRAPRAGDLAPAMIAGALMLAAGVGYGFLLSAMGEDLAWSSWSVPRAFSMVTVVLLPALVEEWLCRGVLWRACNRIVDEKTTIVVTAVLFGLMHVLAWGPFGFPSRAVGGLILGSLRARTDSLAPCVLAHALNNFAAAGLM